MATQQQRIIELAQAIAQDIRELNLSQGLLASLSTTSKTSLVDAINELYLAISNALGNDANFAATLAEQMGKRVRVDATQTFTVEEQAQGCANLGIGNPDTDLLAVYTTAKA